MANKNTGLQAYTGVDISVYQGDVDFNTLSEHVDFAILRLCTTYYGGIKVDTKFLTNYTNARRAGIPVGVYVYSYNTSTREAEASAKAVVDYLKSNSITLELPVWYDFEEVSRNTDSLKIANTAIVEAFLYTLKDGGYSCGLYTFQNFYKSGLDSGRLKDFDLWLAKWSSTPPDGLDRDYQVWQYSNNGTMPGIPAVVDLNYCYKKYWRGPEDNEPMPEPSGGTVTTTEYLILSGRIKELETKALEYDKIIKALKEVLA